MAAETLRRRGPEKVVPDIFHPMFHVKQCLRAESEDGRTLGGRGGFF